MSCNDSKKWVLFLMFLAAAVILASCGKEEIDPQKVVDEAISAHGGGNYKNVIIEFDFRDKHYKAEYGEWKFVYERTYHDSALGNVRDVKSSDSTYREVNGEWVPISGKQRGSIDGGVNSVIYFATLPRALNDKAVIKKYLGDTEINGKEYHEIEVTFKQQGGGEDFQDRYVYWFNKEDKTMDYLAYYFFVNESGSRFREVYNERRVGGILFSDHHNFTNDELEFGTIEKYDSVMNAGGLEKVSEIIIENVKVTPLK